MSAPATSGPAASSAGPRPRQRRPAVMPPRDQVDDDTPLLLAIAAALAFPDQSMTEKTLRGAIEHGRLVGESHGRRWYTTLGDIKRMRELCRANLRGSASGSASEKADPEFGLSSTERAKLAQDALQTTLLAQIASSKNTSRRGTSQTSGGVSRKP